MTPDSNRIPYELIRSFRQLRHISWLRRQSIEGCTPAETMLLYVLYRHMREGLPGMKISEISRRLRVSMPSVTQMLNVLEARGLLERSPDPADRRAVRIRLTESGQAGTVKLEEKMLQGLNDLIGHLGRERCMQLVQTLDDVYRFYADREEIT